MLLCVTSCPGNTRKEKDRRQRDHTQGVFIICKSAMTLLLPHLTFPSCGVIRDIQELHHSENIEQVTTTTIAKTDYDHYCACDSNRDCN